MRSLKTSDPKLTRVLVVAVITAAAVIFGVVTLIARSPGDLPAAAGAVVIPSTSRLPPSTIPPTTAEPTTTVPHPETTTTSMSSDAGGSQGGIPARPEAHPGPPSYPTTVAAAAVDSIVVYDNPGGNAKMTLPSPYGSLRTRLVFRVLERQGDWLHVLIRVRPNGTHGWVNVHAVTVTQTDWSIDVDLTAKVMTIYNKDQVMGQNPVADGTASTPTPVGEFFITEVVTGGGGAYGPYAFGLSAHSDVLTEFAGGDGQVALHGTNAPGLLGTAASHGCVRMPNAVSQYLAEHVQAGTPVRLHH